MARSHGSPSRLSVGARVLASLGALAVLVVALTVVDARRSLAVLAAADRIDASTVVTERLVAMQSALEWERGYAAGIRIAADFGIDPAAVKAVIDMDMVAERDAFAALADQHLAALGADAPVTAAEVAAARAGDFAALSDRLAAAVAERAATVRREAGAIDGDLALQDAARDLETATALPRLVLNVVFTALEAVIADQADTPAVVDRVLAARTRAEDLLADLGSRPGPVGAQASAFVTSAEYLAVQRLITERVADRIRAGTVSPAGIGVLLQLRGVWEVVTTLRDRATEVITVAAAELRGATGRAAHAAQQEVLRAAAVLVGALALAAASAAWLTRTVVRPVKALERHAAQLSQGDPPADPLGLGGAREVGVAAAAFNRLVDALRTGERQMTALAAGDLRHPALGQHLPGRLGAALAGAVERLSESIATSQTVTERLAHEALHDGLTHLPNRRAALSALEAAALRCSAGGGPLAVLFVDLDGFKAVNDRHGHAAGDAVLVAVAARLREAVGPERLVARLGGDEFLVLVDDGAGDLEVAALRRALEATVAEPIALAESGVAVRVGASIGVALHEAGQPVDDLLSAADESMYRMKAGTRGHR